MSHIAYERVAVRPGIADVDRHLIRFVDGREETFDTMIAATGYEIDLPFLPEGAVKVADRHAELYKRVLSPGSPGLYFVGFFNVSGGANIRMMDVQAEWVAALAAEDVLPPDERAMKRWIAQEKHEIATRYPDSPRYGLELDPRAYPKEVAIELACLMLGPPDGPAVLRV